MRLECLRSTTIVQLDDDWQLTSLNGFVPFPPASLWNTDISAAPVDPNSANIISYIGSAITLHPDFGSGTYHSQTMGIPYQVVSGTQPKVTVKLGAYSSESDPGPMPNPSNALIEGYPKPGTGDRHRETSGVVTPAQTTTYTLYSTNQYGRSTASVTVTVR